MKLIVGLGNPGNQYADSRHNAGFHWVSRLVDQENVSLKMEARFQGFCARVHFEQVQLWLLMPQTFMNASGRSVLALCQYYKILPEEILVVHDELDLLPGVAKLKWDGGLGGHNGLKDIAAHLATKAFWRLRIGIGHPGDKKAVVNYVLHPPSQAESVQIDEAIDQSLAIWPFIARGDCQAAMLKLHTKS